MKPPTINSVLILTPTLFEAEVLFGQNDADTCYTSKASIATTYDNIRFEYKAICGFGLAAAGVGTGHRLSQIVYKESVSPPVILAGIAGTYDPEKYPVGSVVCATSVQCVGVGAGSGEEHKSAESMGWVQGLPLNELPPVYDSLELFTPPNSSELTGAFLSVASASGNLAEAEARAKRYPDAIGEEMEGFSVGLACRIYDSPLFMIRGISNIAGDRDKSHWKAAEALKAVRAKLDEVVKAIFNNQRA